MTLEKINAMCAFIAEVDHAAARETPRLIGGAHDANKEPS